MESESDSMAEEKVMELPMEKTEAVLEGDIAQQKYVSKQGFTWIDIQGSSPDGMKGFRKFLKVLAEEHNLHPYLMKDCMSSNHLPKIETSTWKGKVTTMILTRYFDIQARKDEDHIQELTNKLVIFITDDHLITIHRKDVKKLQDMRALWTVTGEDDIAYHNMEKIALVAQFMQLVVESYTSECERGSVRLDKYEENIFREGQNKMLEKLYHIKRRASVFKRMLKMTETLLKSFHSKQTEGSQTYNVTLRLIESAEQASYAAQDLHETADNMINLYVTLASHRTNELMKVLTIFSAFFIPLTYLAGVYGMNFEHMPELKYEWAYAAWWIIQLCLVAGIYSGFCVKGMLPSPLEWFPCTRRRSRKEPASSWVNVLTAHEK